MFAAEVAGCRQSAPQRIQLTLPAVCFSPTSLEPQDQCQAAAPDNPSHHLFDHGALTGLVDAVSDAPDVAANDWPRTLAR